MKRTPAIILTLVSILLCGCPGLAVCALSAYALTPNSQLLQNIGISGSSPAASIAGIVVALVLILIPIVVGIITLRKPKAANMQPAVAPRPAPMPAARAPVQQPPAMVSRPAPAPAPQPTPQVYQAPVAPSQPEPLPPAAPPTYEPPAPVQQPEPEPLPPAPPVYVPPAPVEQIEPEPLPPAPAMPPAEEQAPAPEVSEEPAVPPEDQPEEAAPPQVMPDVEMPLPPVLDGATRLASNWCLAFVSGPFPVSTIVLGKKVSVGRSPENDVVIADPLISRQHAIVELVGGTYQVTDLGSANGTAINDVLLTEPAHLKVGDLVKFGGTVFRFQPSYDLG